MNNTTHLSALENGKHLPSTDTLMRFSKALECEPSIFFSDRLEDTALSQLFDLVTTRGRMNHNGHKQLESIVLIGGAPQEIVEDGTLEITESRALELLEALR